MTEIKTVGQFREAMKHAEDEEPIYFDLEEHTLDGVKKKSMLKCVGIGSSGGGRITVVWLDRETRRAADYVI